MTTTPRTPPRYVPTLTDVVQADQELLLAASEDAALPEAPTLLPCAGDLEEQLVHRVLQRVDMVLEQRLRSCIAQVTQEQTRSLVPRLREEVESVVRQSVYEAMAQELAAERSRG